MKRMTEHIREEVRIAMIRQHLSQAELADSVGLTRQHLSSLLTGHRGKLPDAWRRLLDGLGLELTVRPKGREVER